MSRSVLVLNAGSSSLKYQLIDVATEAVLGKGIVQRIGDASGTLDHTVNGEKTHTDAVIPDHEEAMRLVLDAFARLGPSLDEVAAVGHRTVHGGEAFREPVLIDDACIATMRDLIPLAPLHNPACIAGIEAARRLLPQVPHVAVFDTAFFADLPAEAYTYAVDRETAREHGIRRYGFHGTSHDYVSRVAGEALGPGRAQLDLIVCHLGNGASISAIQHGRPIETSMGMTPLQGLVMGTRSGDVDPGLHAFLARTFDWGPEQIDTWLNKKAGILGLAGVIDMRELEDRCATGDAAAGAALDVYVHRLVFYVGGYLALLGRADAIVFTAGVGENSPIIRGRVAERLGLPLDAAANEVRSGDPRVVSTADAKIKVMVVPTNEELSIAQQTLAVVAR